MAYGGGKWTPPIMNKVLSGTYISFVSKDRASNIFGERGYAAVGLNFDYGQADELITVEASDLQKESLAMFGLEYTDKALMPLREMLKNAKTVYVYRLNGDGDKSSATQGSMTVTTKYPGVGGNNFSLTVQNNVDDPEVFDVSLFVGDSQVYKVVKVENNEEGLEKLNANPYVVIDGELEAVVGLKLEGGTNGTEKASSHTKFLELIESKFINTIVYAGEEDAIKNLYISFVERRNYQEGFYFQGVLYNADDPNSELIINVGSSPIIDRSNSDYVSKGALAYWVAGAEAGAEINESLENTIYNGELKISAKQKERELIAAIRKGMFLFHEVEDRYRVLQDINSFTDFSVYKNEDFSKNQIIRVLHEISNSVSTIFNTRYLGKVQNDALGRTVLWNDIHNHALKLQGMGAITDLESDDILVEQGDTKDAVYVRYLVNPTMAMAKLYMSIIVE